MLSCFPCRAEKACSSCLLVRHIQTLSRWENPRCGSLLVRRPQKCFCNISISKNRRHMGTAVETATIAALARSSEAQILPQSYFIRRTWELKCFWQRNISPRLPAELENCDSCQVRKAATWFMVPIPVQPCNHNTLKSEWFKRTNTESTPTFEVPQHC